MQIKDVLSAIVGTLLIQQASVNSLIPHANKAIRRLALVFLAIQDSIY